MNAFRPDFYFVVLKEFCTIIFSLEHFCILLNSSRAEMLYKVHVMVSKLYIYVTVPIEWDHNGLAYLAMFVLQRAFSFSYCHLSRGSICDNIQTAFLSVCKLMF